MENRVPWRRVRLSIQRLTLLTAGLVIAASCARAPSTHPVLTGPPLTPEVHQSSSSARFGRKQTDVADRLRAAAKRWSGTPHRMGRSDADGMDCSGLARRIYKDLFQIELPRTTKGQVMVGHPVDKTALAPGDLVFFQIPQKKRRHVGIYLDRREFIHASTSQGVTISNLATPYWQKAYWTARRVFDSFVKIPGNTTGTE